MTGEEQDHAPVQEQVVGTEGLEAGELVTGNQAQDQGGTQGGTGTTAGVIAAMDALAAIAEGMTPSGSGQAPQPRPQMPMLTPQQVEAVGQRVEPQAVPTTAEFAAATGRVEDTVVIADSESPPQAEEQSSDTEPFTAQELREAARLLRATVAAEDTARELHAGGDVHGTGHVESSIAQRTAEALAQEIGRASCRERV